jgi:hypothetical protein
MNRFKKALVCVMAAIALAFAGAAVSAPAQAATMPNHGTVDCMNVNIVGIWVDQPGNSGWAQFEQTGISGWKNVNWYYTLNSSQYRLHIGCGGTQSAWAKTIVTGWTSGNHSFYCDNVQGYCILG